MVQEYNALFLQNDREAYILVDIQKLQLTDKYNNKVYLKEKENTNKSRIHVVLIYCIVWF